MGSSQVGPIQVALQCRYKKQIRLKFIFYGHKIEYWLTLISANYTFISANIYSKCKITHNYDRFNFSNEK
jgi:hypothetical protein